MKEVDKVNVNPRRNKEKNIQIRAKTNEIEHNWDGQQKGKTSGKKGKCYKRTMLGKEKKM